MSLKLDGSCMAQLHVLTVDFWNWVSKLITSAAVLLSLSRRSHTQTNEIVTQEIYKLSTFSDELFMEISNLSVLNKKIIFQTSTAEF